MIDRDNIYSLLANLSTADEPIIITAESGAGKSPRTYAGLSIPLDIVYPGIKTLSLQGDVIVGEVIESHTETRGKDVNSPRFINPNVLALTSDFDEAASVPQIEGHQPDQPIFNEVGEIIN